MDTKTLYDKKSAAQFYESRYSKNYMHEWPLEKKQRVFKLLRDLPLPEYGSAVDFGCGNGVFTDVLKQALPKWEIFGCDISEVAVNNAKKRFPDCNFFVSDDAVKNDRKFNFLFSHHVLEHVYNMEACVKEMSNMLLPGSFMFHIMPCGNTGSFEDYLASLRTDGINEQIGNRVYFEDEGHVRRLTTEQLTDAVKPGNFVLEKQFYANHKYGSMEWMTRSTVKFIRDLTDTTKAKDAAAANSLLKVRRNLLKQYILRNPASLFIKAKDPTKPPIRYFILLFGYIPYLIDLPYFNKLKRKTEKEWQDKNQDKNGSEMYLFYSRTN